MGSYMVSAIDKKKTKMSGCNFKRVRGGDAH